MRRCVFTELEDERLIWACAEPAISKVNGKSNPGWFCPLAPVQWIQPIENPHDWEEREES
jgi:hypothetical protein